MDGADDTVPRPLGGFGRGTDSGWSDLGVPGSLSVLSSAMLDELRRLEVHGQGADLLEVVDCCRHLNEPMLLSIAVDGWVWPVSLHPGLGLYRAPIDWSKAPPAGLRRARLLDCEPASFLPPRRFTSGRIMPPCHYALDGLIWTLALLGPRNRLLGALAGSERFRAIESGRASVDSRLAGALGSAIARLGGASASFAEICRWPGLDPQRAARLLNGLYLDGRLMQVQAPPDQRDGDSAWSDTVPSRWPLLGLRVGAGTATRAPRWYEE